MGTTMTQRTITVTLYQGDDLSRLGELQQKARALEPREGSTAVENGEYAAATEAYDTLYAEAKSRAVPIELKPLGRRAWQELVLAHPPRPEHDGDQAVGVNEATFPEPLLMASIVGPVWSDAERMEFLDSLTHAQFDVLYQEAFAVNRTVFAPKAPFSASAPSPSSGETSDSPEPSG